MADSKETFELPVKDGAVYIPDELLPKFQPAIDRLTAKRIAEVRAAAGDPVDKERLRQLEEQAKAREIADLEKDKKFEEAAKLRDEDTKKKLADKDEQIAKRETRIRSGLKTEIRAAAIAAGARDESLPELQELLAGRVDLDDDFNPIVKGADGKPAVGKDGKSQSIEGLVSDYLEGHPHHKRAAGGAGGGARGGASFKQGTVSSAVAAAQEKVDAAKEALAKNPRNDAAIIDLQNATRELRKAQGG